MSERVLITGGAGFIGSHLAERLVHDGLPASNLVLLDNLSTGLRPNIEHLLAQGADFVEGDAGLLLGGLASGTSSRSIDAARFNGVGRIFHLAATVGVQRVVDDPSGTVSNNINETIAVLDAAEYLGASVLVTSSSEVYGKCPVLPLREDMDLVYGPTSALRWSYAFTKALDEQLALDRFRRVGLPCVIVRLFNTIGPRQRGRYGMVVPRFVQAAVNQEPLSVYGSGEQSRAFCDVRDVVGALVSLLPAGLQADSKLAGKIFNIGKSEAITIRGLAEKINMLAGNDAGVVFRPYEQVYGSDFEDTPHRLPDTSRIQNAIGWSPDLSLDQTLNELIKTCRNANPAETAG